MTLHLDILLPSFSKSFQPELSLAWIDRWRRSDAGALALGSRCDSLHSVEVLRCGAPFFYPPAGAPAQGSDNTFTPTVRAFREGFHFVIITQQLQREEDECIFHHAQSKTFEILRTKYWIVHKTQQAKQRKEGDISSYLREDALLAIYLLLQPVTLFRRALKSWPGIFPPGLRRRRAPRNRRTAHQDENAQLAHVVRLTERRRDKIILKVCWQAQPVTS